MKLERKGILFIKLMKFISGILKMMALLITYMKLGHIGNHCFHFLTILQNGLFQNCFPLLKYDKTQIIKKLESYDKEILASCWTCENPKVIKTKRCKDNTIEMYVEACGSCPPCENLQNTDNISFDLIKKYRIVFIRNNFHKLLGDFEKRVIKNIKNKHLPSKLFKVEEAGKEVMAKIKRQLNKKEQLKNNQNDQMESIIEM